MLTAGPPLLRVPEAASLRASGQLTVEAWIRPAGAGSDASGGGIIVNKEGEYEIARYADGTIRWAIANGSPGWTWVDTGFVAPLDEWTHIAFVYDGSSAKTYANGALVHSADATGNVSDADWRQALQIGSREAGGQMFDGRIDEVRVWQAARTADEIGASWNRALAGDEAGLTGYWRLDEASGATLVDASGDGNIGAITGVPARDTRLYSFAATAGERFFFDSQLLSGENFTVRLFDPQGNVVWGPQWFSDDHDVFTVPLTGTYTFAFEGRIYNDGAGTTWAFNLQPVADESSALTLGARVDGAIEHVGQQQSFTFTLAAPATVVFDSLVNRGDMTWTLAGPEGTVVGCAALRLVRFGRVGCQPRAAAEGRRLHADGRRLPGRRPATSPSACWIWRARPRSPTTPTSRANSSRATRPRPTASTPRRATRSLFDWASMSGGNAYWRLIDPTGKQVFGPNYMNADVGPLTLLLGGAYTLLVEGRAWETGKLAYAFKATLQGNDGVPVLTGTEIDFAVRVDGSLAAAGEIDDYVFEITEPRRIVFDGFVPNNNGAFRFTLVGPRGEEVGGRSIYASESFELNGDPAIELLLPGTYQVRIHADGSTTGDYAFRLLDLEASATALTPGTPVASTLSPANETDVYRFDATAGQRFYFDMQALDPNYGDWVSWRLYDPIGRTVFGPTGFYVNNDVGPLTLDLDGSYTLLIEGRSWTSQYFGQWGYTFNVAPVTDAAPQPLTIGEKVDATLANPGQSDVWTFSLAEAKTLYFDALAGANLTWTLTGPAGNIVSRNIRSSDSYELGGTNPLLKLGPGDYRITIDGSADTTGAYAFRLRDVRAEASAIGLSTAITGALEPANETDLYQFEVTNASDRFYFDRLTYGDYWNTTYRLFDPDGNQFWGGYIWPDDQGPSAFGKAGTWLLMVEGRVGNEAASNGYSFNLQKVDDIQAALTIGATASGTIDHVGQRAVYTFSLTEAKQLLFDALAPNNNSPDFRWTLTGPRGVEIDGRQLYYSESHEIGGTSPLLSLIAGDYTLVLDPVGEQKGAFSFRLLDIGGGTVFAANDLVTGQLNPVNETDVYRFTGAADKLYYIDRQTLSGANSDWYTWRLFDEFGRQILGPSNLGDVDLFSLPRDGVYTLIVEGRVWTTQYRASTDYSFKLLEIADDVVDLVPGQSYGLDKHFTDGVVDGAIRLDSLRSFSRPEQRRHRADRHRQLRAVVQGRLVLHDLAADRLQGQQQRQPAQLQPLAEQQRLPAPVERQRLQRDRQHRQRLDRRGQLVPRRRGHRPGQQRAEAVPRRRRGRERRAARGQRGLRDDQSAAAGHVGREQHAAGRRDRRLPAVEPRADGRRDRRRRPPQCRIERRRIGPGRLPEGRRDRGQHARRRHRARQRGADHPPVAGHAGRRRRRDHLRPEGHLPLHAHRRAARLFRLADRQQSHQLDARRPARHARLGAHVPTQRLGQRHQHPRPRRRRLHAGRRRSGRRHRAVRLPPARPGTGHAAGARRRRRRHAAAGEPDRRLPLRRDRRRPRVLRHAVGQRRLPVLASARPVGSHAVGARTTCRTTTSRRRRCPTRAATRCWSRAGATPAPARRTTACACSRSRTRRVPITLDGTSGVDPRRGSKARSARRCSSTA